MYSKKDRENRDFQFELAALNNKNRNNMAVSLTIISGAVAFAALTISIRSSPLWPLSAITSIILSVMAVNKLYPRQKMRNKKKETTFMNVQTSKRNGKSLWIKPKKNIGEKRSLK